MVRTSKRVALVLATIALTLVIAAPALAITTSSTTRQIGPGQMQRVIWSQCQVAQYTVNVTHAGDLHAELTFNSGWDSNFLNVFIWDPINAQFQNINQGWYTIGTGKCVVDYAVTDISADGREIVDPDETPDSGDEYLKGDNYNIVVVNYDDYNSAFSIWGYSAQTDLTAGYGAEPTNENNFYTSTYRYPKKGVLRLEGAPYGVPFDFRPTSAGILTADMQWPADVNTKTVTYDVVNAPKPAVWEEYLYVGADWDTAISNYLRPNPNWRPTAWGTDPNKWYGYHDVVRLTPNAALNTPGKIYHYAPALDLVTSDPKMGGFAPLTEGRVTMGYKATLTYPSNLVITKAPAAVAAGMMATIKGNFALNGAWVGPNSPITIQYRVMSSRTWKNVATTKTAGVLGAWSAKVKIKAGGKFRAQAAGDATTGLAVESSDFVTINMN
jgi:hypothetical protein